MYRLLLVLCFVSCVAGQCDTDSDEENGNRNWFWPGRSGDDDDYNDRDTDIGHGRNNWNRNMELAVAAISRKLMAANQLMEQFCTNYSTRALREVYAVEHFKLTVRLAGFNAGNIKVKVRQRVVYIMARSCESAEYAAVRVLPDVVDAGRGSWTLRRGVLSVQFPYTVTPDTKLRSRCGRGVSTGVITVPQSSVDTEDVNHHDYDLLFGDEQFRVALMRFLRQHDIIGGEQREDDGTNEYVDDDKEPAED